MMLVYVFGFEFFSLVCTPAQVEQSPATCATFLSLGFCGFSLGTSIGQQAFSTCPITCGFCQGKLYIK